MNDDKLTEVTDLSGLFAQGIKDYSDVEIATVICGMLDRLAYEYDRDSVGILKSVSAIFPLTFEQLQESMEGGD